MVQLLNYNCVTWLKMKLCYASYMLLILYTIDHFYFFPLFLLGVLSI